mgnify:CR=1 FL=1
MFSLKNEFGPLEQSEEIHCDPKLSINKHKITSLITKTAKCPVTCHNDLELLKDGQQTFEHIFHALDRRGVGELAGALSPAHQPFIGLNAYQHDVERFPVIAHPGNRRTAVRERNAQGYRIYL